MQKQTKQATLTRTRMLRIHGKLSRGSMHRRLAVAVVGAVLLVGAGATTRDTTASGPGESP